MDAKNNIMDFDGLAEEFINLLKSVHGRGKPVTQKVLSKELSKLPTLRHLFTQEKQEGTTKLADAYEREITMFQSRIETLEQERKKVDRVISELEYQAAMETDFNKRLILLLTSLARTPENEVYFDLLDSFKDLIAENADLEHRERALRDIKNSILKHEVDSGARPSKIGKVFAFGDHDSAENQVKKLKKACLHALSELEKVLGNKYRDTILILQVQVKGSEDFDYLLSLRSNLIKLIRTVTTDVQVEKEGIINFLLDVGEKLAVIEKEFSASSETSNRYHHDDISFSNNLEKEIASMNESSGRMESLEGLKSLVTLKLDIIQRSLKNKRKEFTIRIEKEHKEQEKLKSTFEMVIGSVSEQNRMLKEQSRMDPLTGIYNRRVFEDSIDTELDRFHRYDQPFSLIFFDIDRFKDINDNYGHEAGDKVLVAIANRIKEMLRKPDIFARYGGEEFVVILPETPLKQGLAVAAKLREEIETAIFEYEGERVLVTISIGITEAKEADRQYQTMVNRADSLMYRAKERGRNSVVSDYDFPGTGNSG